MYFDVHVISAPNGRIKSPQPFILRESLKVLRCDLYGNFENVICPKNNLKNLHDDKKRNENMIRIINITKCHH